MYIYVQVITYIDNCQYLTRTYQQSLKSVLMTQERDEAIAKVYEELGPVKAEIL